MGRVKRIFEELSYANVVATLALFVALGGTGYAISKLPKDSVKAKQIAKSAVGSPEIKDGAVGAAEVADGSLLLNDFASGQMPSGPQGPAGADGRDGVDGEDGKTGPPGPTFASARTDRVPAPNPDLILTSRTITTPAAGRLFVMFSATPPGFNQGSNQGVRVDCSAAGDVHIGLYVNGIPVPGTNKLFSDNVGYPVLLTGVTPVLPTGAQDLQLGATCASSNTVVDSAVTEGDNFNAILLGG